jgi:hypothetical protein
MFDFWFPDQAATCFDMLLFAASGALWLMASLMRPVDARYSLDIANGAAPTRAMRTIWSGIGRRDWRPKGNPK